MMLQANIPMVQLGQVGHWVGQWPHTGYCGAGGGANDEAPTSSKKFRLNYSSKYES